MRALTLMPLWFGLTSGLAQAQVSPTFRIDTPDGGKQRTLYWGDDLVRGISLDEPDVLAREYKPGCSGDCTPYPPRMVSRLEACITEVRRDYLNRPHDSVSTDVWSRAAELANPEQLEGDQVPKFNEHGTIEWSEAPNGDAARCMLRDALKRMPRKPNVVRIPINPGFRGDKGDGFCALLAMNTSTSDLTTYLRRLVDPIVEEAAANKLGVILDWHIVAKEVTGESQDYRPFQACSTAFLDIAIHEYKADNRVAFELFNEPWASDFAEADDMSGDEREHLSCDTPPTGGGSDIIPWSRVGTEFGWETKVAELPAERVLIGGPRWSKPYAHELSDLVCDGKAVQVFHVYANEGEHTNIPERLTELTGRDRRAVPVVVTEWGFTGADERRLARGDKSNAHIEDTTSGAMLHQRLEQYGWVAWTYSIFGRQTPALLKVDGCDVGLSASGAVVAGGTPAPGGRCKQRNGR